MDLFGTAGIRGSVSERVNPSLARAVGRAVGADADEVVVARDGRETGPALVAAVTAGLESAGAVVRDAGVLPTPALAFASRRRHGVMVTASHNPPTDNGIKCFVDGVEFDRDAERRVERLVEDDPPPVPWDQWGSGEPLDTLDAYREAVGSYARSIGDDLDGLRVAVDAGNGTGSLATPSVLSDLGAEVVALSANVDGHFPARESKPTPESLRTFRRFVTEGRFDVGVAHDGDADRIAVVDEAGEIVHEDTVLAILAERYVRQSGAGDPVVVTTPNASARIDERVRAAGGRVERCPLGALHEGMATARDDGGPETCVVFAAEPWKHIHPRFGGWIDGVASAAVLARLVAGADGLDPLREPITELPYLKLDIACPDPAKDGAMAGVRDRLREAFPDASIDTTYGVRIERADGSWILVRPSGTEPYLRVYAEGEEVNGLAETVRAAVEAAVADAQ